MNLILHIGHDKTGTTSIQKDLHNNADTLLKSGILYHDRLNHFNIIFELGGTTRAPKDKHERCKSEAKVLLKEIRERALRHDVKYILISAENLFYIDSQQQKDLIKSIGIKFNSIRIIAYIRRPADLYLSLMQQRLKADHLIIDPFQFENNIYLPLERWYRLVGKDQINLQAFGKSTLKDGNVVADFYKRLEHLTGIDLSHLSLSSKKDNSSLSAEQMILLQMYRRDVLPKHSGYYHPISNKLLFFFKEAKVQLSNALSMTKPVLKPSLDLIISEKHENIIRNVDNLFKKDFLSIFRNININKIDSKSETNQPCTDISQTFNSYNPHTLELLLQMIPNYNDRIFDLNDARSIPSFVLENPHISAYYSRYLFLHSDTYKPVSKYLSAYSFKKSLELGLTDKRFYRYISKVLLLNKNLIQAASALRKSF